MMRFTTLLKHPADWMAAEEGAPSVVLTSRVRLARNLADVPFPGWARKNERQEIRDDLQGILEALPVMKNGQF